ncbi:MAG: FKBP-type peptidyl-prolyl cis-trans isomerase [Methanomassiliicoccales archaeon]|nr:FKBP-type peptidyl-prolyl cis-trans isomerase [Methanomassiliicoccales archaeon]
MRFKRMSRDVTAVNVLLIVLIVILMVSASSVVILVYQSGQAEEDKSTIVEVGMTINVDYTGKLTDGRIFDTSNYTIASNDALYPKSLSFTLKSESKYDPLSFTVGGGTLIKGFDSAVVGMRIGETKTVTLTPDQAYGSMDESKLVTFNLTEEVSLLVTLTSSEFEDEYGSSPVEGMTVTDPYYGWAATVLEFNTGADRVTVKNVPTMNAVYRIYGDSPSGWNVMVTNIDSSSNAITIKHQLTDSDNDYVMGTDDVGDFIVTQIDTVDGTAVKNYNSELLGKTLVFTITIVSIDELT